MINFYERVKVEGSGIEMGENDIGKRFQYNTLWIMLDKVLHMVLSLVITSLTARYLGKANYGVINYGLAYVNIFTICCKLGIDAVIVNEMIKHKEDTGSIVGTTCVLRFVSGLLSVVLTAIFVVVLKPGNTVVFMITCIQALAVVFAAFDTIDFYFQAKLKSKYTSIAKSVSYIFVCALRVLLIWIKADVVWFAWAGVLDTFVVAILLLIFYRMDCAADKKHKLAFSGQQAKQLLTVSRPFILSNLLVVIYTQMDRLMIGSLSANSDVENGLYAAGMNIAMYWMFIPNALIDSARPIIMTHKTEGREGDYKRTYSKLLAGVIWVSILAGVGFSLFSKLCIFILYGREFYDAIPILIVLVWSKLFSLIGTARGIWLVCEDYSQYVKYLIGGGALVNLVLNFIFIPKAGAMGAAAATLITEIVGAVLLPLCMKKMRPFLKMLWDAFMLKGIGWGKNAS